MTDTEKLQVQIETAAHLEAGVMGADGVYPDWVYEARAAIQHQKDKTPWLPDLLRILGWQGGTVHQALSAVARLVAAEEQREKRKK